MDGGWWMVDGCFVRLGPRCRTPHDEISPGIGSAAGHMPACAVAQQLEDSDYIILQPLMAVQLMPGSPGHCLSPVDSSLDSAVAPRMEGTLHRNDPSRASLWTVLCGGQHTKASRLYFGNLVGGSWGGKGKR